MACMLIHPDSIPDCLEGMSEDKRSMVNDSLCNDEYSTDDEMVDHWISQGLSQDEANAAIAFRDQALREPLFQLFPTASAATP